MEPQVTTTTQPITPPIQTAPQQPVTTNQVVFASFWSRWAALFIDSIITTIISVIVGFVIGIAFGAAGSQDAVIKVVAQIISVLATWTYFVYMTNSFQGATLGKRALGIRVVSEDYGTLSLGRIILRETIGKLVSGIIIGIGYLMVAFTEKKQALHDKFAKTVVVYVDPNNKKKGLTITMIILSLIIPILIMGILMAVVLASLNSARMKSQDAANRAKIMQEQIQKQLDAQTPTTN